MEYVPIVNDNKTSPFKPTREIRQGDPLSPYIFILDMEYLLTQIQEVVSSHAWKPFKLKSHNLEISHLLFVDDIVLFAQADRATIQIIKNVLPHLCNSSGMGISLEKSKIWISPNVIDTRKETISNFFQIWHSEHLGNYLGYPLKSSYTTNDFYIVINNLNQKLQGWKKYLLSSLAELK